MYYWAFRRLRRRFLYVGLSVSAPSALFFICILQRFGAFGTGFYMYSEAFRRLPRRFSFSTPAHWFKKTPCLGPGYPHFLILKESCGGSFSPTEGLIFLTNVFLFSEVGVFMILCVWCTACCSSLCRQHECISSILLEITYFLPWLKSCIAVWAHYVCIPCTVYIYTSLHVTLPPCALLCVV